MGGRWLAGGQLETDDVYKVEDCLSDDGGAVGIAGGEQEGRGAEDGGGLMAECASYP